MALSGRLAVTNGGAGRAGEMLLWPPVLITRLLSVIGSTMPKPNNTVTHAPCTLMAFCYYTPPSSPSPLNELSSSLCRNFNLFRESRCNMGGRSVVSKGLCPHFNRYPYLNLATRAFKPLISNLKEHWRRLFMSNSLKAS